MHIIFQNTNKFSKKIKQYNKATELIRFPLSQYKQIFPKEFVWDIPDLHKTE